MSDYSNNVRQPAPIKSQRRGDVQANIIFAAGYIALLVVVFLPRSFWL